MSAITGAGIQPATVAALDEAATVIAAHPDQFAETPMHHWRARLFATLGQFDAAETEVGLCWAAGRSGAVRLVEFLGPLAEARLAAARGDTATAVGALRRTADGGRRTGIVMQVPAALAGLACLAAIASDVATAAAAVARRAPSSAAAGRRPPPPRCATPRASWPGTGANSPTPSTWSARPPCSGTGRDRIDACDGIELLGVLAAARERYADAARLLAAADAARRPLRYLAPGFTANRGAAARAASQARDVLGEESFTQAWEQGQGLTLDDAVAYAARKGGGRKRPPQAGPA